MNLIETALDGVYIIEPTIFRDARGYFYESYNRNAFEKAGLHYTFVQDNQSMSSYGTIRGIHFQKGDFAQAKLVWISSSICVQVHRHMVGMFRSSCPKTITGSC